MLIPLGSAEGERPVETGLPLVDDALYGVGNTVGSLPPLADETIATATDALPVDDALGLAEDVLGQVLGEADGLAPTAPRPEVPATAILVPTSTVFVLLQTDKAVYTPGQTVNVASFIVNNGQTEVVLKAFDQMGLIFAYQQPALENGTNETTTLDPTALALEPLFGFSVMGKISFNHATGSPQEFVIPPQSTCQLPNALTWEQQTIDGTTVGPGVYPIGVEVLPNIAGGLFMRGATEVIIGDVEVPSPSAVISSLACGVRDVVGEITAAAVADGVGPYGRAYNARGYMFDFLSTPLDHAQRWTTTYNWDYRDLGRHPGVTSATSAMNMVSAALQYWVADPNSYFTAGTGTLAPNNNEPTRTDGRNTVWWGTSQGIGYADAQVMCVWVTASANRGQYTDCDMQFNSGGGLTWCQSVGCAGNDMQSIAAHEAGHVVGLKHAPDNQQTMYSDSSINNRRFISWGDKAGIRYLLPNSWNGPTGLYAETADMDITFGNINGVGSTDMVIGWVEELSGTGSNAIKYVIGFDMSSSTGFPTSTSAIRTLVSTNVGATTSGLGLALGSFNGDAGGRPDLIAVWVHDASGENTIYHQIGWDLTTAGAVGAGLSLRYPFATGVGFYTQGAGACLTNLDTNPKQDLIVAWADNPGGENSIRYKVGYNVAGDGYIPTYGNTWTSQDTWTGGETAGVGLACGQIDGLAGPDLIIGWVDNPAGNNNAFYRVGWNILLDGTTADWNYHKEAAGGRYESFGHETQGFGIGIPNIGTPGSPTTIPEIVTLWMDNPAGPSPGGNNKIIGRTEWDFQIGCHI
jgi:hypothetical protein